MDNTTTIMAGSMCLMLAYVIEVIINSCMGICI